MLLHIELVPAFLDAPAQAGWEPGQGRRKAKKPVVQALSHHLCLGPNTIYHLLKSVELTASSGICDIANYPEAPHPSIAVAASCAGDKAPEVLRQAVEKLT